MTDQETDRDWSQAQDWKGMDGATAFLLINRHADGWGDTRAMMEAWLAANSEEAVKQERERCLTICDELRQHFSDYKDTALLNGDVELSNAASGEPRACEVIANAIRS